MKFWLTASICSVLVGSFPASGGQGSMSGHEPASWWAEAHCSVVVAVIRDVKKVREPVLGEEIYVATLTLKAALAGQLDPSVTPTLRVRFYADSYGSAITSAPSDGATVLAVLKTGQRNFDEK